MKELNKLSKYEKTRKVVVFIVDILIYHLSFLLSFLIRYDFEIPTFNYRAYQGAFIYIMMGFGIINLLSGIYVFYNKRKIDILYSTVINQLLMIIMITVLTFFGRWFAFPRTIIIISSIISSVLLVIWRIVVYKLYQRIGGMVKVMVVGSEKNCKRVIRNFDEARNYIYVITTAAYDNYYENVATHLDEIEAVYLAEGIPSEEQKEILTLLTAKDKKIFLSSAFENLLQLNSNIMNIEDETFLELTEYSISPELGAIKRLIDLLISIFLIIVTAPIQLITTILVKFTSPGPVLYKQTRITKGQQEFDILKFRTMSTTAEKDTGPVLSTTNDARVTSIGKHLRSLRIDELPQLFNVLKGDMSLVGPRPERPYFVDQFQELNRYYYLRHNVRAGITGYAQVSGKYATDFNSKLNFDLLYIKKYSLILDIQILLQTIKTLFDKVSSQGVDEESDIDEYKIPDYVKVYR